MQVRDLLCAKAWAILRKFKFLTSHTKEFSAHGLTERHKNQMCSCAKEMLLTGLNS